MTRRARAAIFTAALGLATSVVIMGCASKPKATDAQATRQAIFVPPPPAPPRLQFLTSFDVPNAWESEQQQTSSFAQFVAGDEKKSEKVDDRFVNPYGVAAHKGVIYVCDVGGDWVHVIDVPNKQYRRLTAPFKIENPVNISIAPDGTKFLCDSGRRSILIFNAQDSFVGEIGDPQNCTPLDVVVNGDELFVADVVGGEVEVWDRRGNALRTISSKGATPDTLGEPTNLDISGDLLFVTDTRQQAVKVFTLDGQFQNMIGQPGATLGSFGRPKGIAVDDSHHVFVADAQFDAIQIFRPDGRLLLKFGAPGDQPDSIVMPAGLVIDKTSIDAFKQYIDPSFEPEYLLFEANQFGVYRLSVYAFGKSKNVDASAYNVVEPTTQPATQPAMAGESTP